ncbi:hypothetical protein N0V90_012164 [Kalmusia sp. IMI 367209]|nr:hypothetical protein N0V90_012164 [Kalmusia sp. IMI 367209]
MASPFPSFTPTWRTSTYTHINPLSNPTIKSSISGKSVLITGGGGSIGTATALSFAGAGATHIALLSRKVDKLQAVKTCVEEKYTATKIYIYPVDVTDKVAIDYAFASFSHEIGGGKGEGKIDILISGAGHGLMHHIRDIDPSTFSAHFDINVKGALLVTQAFLHHGKENGVVVNLTSAASLMPTAQACAYSASKAAAAQFFSVLQVEHPALRVFNVHPGVVESAMNEVNKITAMDDVSLPADFTVWVATEEAAFLKGRYVFANYDAKELMERKEEIEASGLLSVWLEGQPRIAVAEVDKVLQGN